MQIRTHKSTKRFLKFHTNMNNNSHKSNSLRIYYKQDEESTALQTQVVSDPEYTLNFKKILDSFGRLKSVLVRRFAAFYHKVEHYTFGVMTKVRFITFCKVCILAIIMLFLFKKDVALDIKMAKFAAINKTTEKTTHSNRRKKSNPDFVASASFGNAISHDLAPASPEELRDVNVRSYINSFSQVAITEMDKFGIPASITMAQAIVESRSGTSVLAVKNNNHFGIKCFSKVCPKGHCNNHTDDHHKDFFRNYKGANESWRAHSDFLMKNSYRRLLKYGKNYKAWAIGLKEIGYATDQNYDKKLIAVIEKYNLYKLDDI
jgi:flagellum-specific peptidoglycan hydrolase FlgJ